VLEPLSQTHHVIAIDLVGFGRSAMKLAAPYFDIELWVRQLRQSLTYFGSERVDVLGHSLSGYLALRLAGADCRVRRVMTTGSMGVPFALNAHLSTVWTFPEDRGEILEAGRVLVSNKALLTPEWVETRTGVLSNPSYRAYFKEMFAGDKQAYIDSTVLTENELANVRCPVLLVHGRNDLPIPYEDVALPLLERLPRADHFAIADCGHSPAFEHPDKVIRLARDFFGA